MVKKSMKQPTIEIKHLVKTYGMVTAVQDVSFTVGEGEIFGLIGPDGAGKTSIIRILVSLLHADSGEALVQGKSVDGAIAYVRAHVGYMPQRFSLYPDLTVEENIDFFGDLFAVPASLQKTRKEKLYDFSKLGPFKKRRAGALSGGMKQKLALSCMLMHEPKVVVLDEPTFGVDPVSREEFWNILKQLSANGTSILVTTAYMDEARLCDRVGLIFEGSLLAVDTPEHLVNTFPTPIYRLSGSAPHVLYEALAQTPLKNRISLFGDGVHILDTQGEGPEALRRQISDIDAPWDALEPIAAGMEDLFLSLMKE